MPTQLSLGMIIVGAFEGALILGGLGLLWRFQFSPEARERLRGPLPLGRWNISLSMFMQTVLCVICGAVLFQLGLAQLLHKFVPSIATSPDLWTIVVGSSIHIGALLGLIVSHFLPDTFDPLPAERSTVPGAATKLPKNRIVAGGAATLVTLMPIITLVAMVWQLLFRLLNIPLERQELVDLFNKADSRWQIAGMILFAVVIAPLAEELVFRAGLFRFLRTRVPRWVALCGPATLFAAVHGNLAALLPLFVLGIVFSLAYERTGRILVPVIAHGLFNLNTIIVLLSGISV